MTAPYHAPPHPGAYAELPAGRPLPPGVDPHMRVRTSRCARWQCGAGPNRACSESRHQARRKGNSVTRRDGGHATLLLHRLHGACTRLYSTPHIHGGRPLSVSAPPHRTATASPQGASEPRLATQPANQGLLAGLSLPSPPALRTGTGAPPPNASGVQCSRARDAAPCRASRPDA